MQTKSNKMRIRLFVNGLLGSILLLFPLESFCQKKIKKKKGEVEAPAVIEKKDSLIKPAEKPLMPEIEGPAIHFEHETFDFGKITQGDIVRHQFKFKNIGNKNLEIKDVKGSCGCTITKFSKEPVPPQAEGTIDVSFNSAAKMGPQNKSLTVFTNAEPSIKVLYIKGEVISPTTPSYLQQNSHQPKN